MAVVGTAYVNIRALTDRLKSDVDKAFAKLKDDIEVNIGANTSAAMAKIEELIDTAETADVSVDVQANTAEAEQELDGLTNRRRTAEIDAQAATAAAANQLAYVSRARTVDMIVKLEKTSVAKVAATITALSGARQLNNYFTHLSDTMKNMDQTVMRFSGWAPSIVTVFSAITSGVGGVVTVATDLGKALGVLWAAPGIFAGFAAGITASYIGFKDMSKVLKDLGPQFTALSNSMSSKFWSKAEAPMRSMIKTLFPQLRDGMIKVSASTGNFFGAMATGFKEAMKGGALASILNNVATSTDIASKSMGNFTESFTVITKAGAAYLPRLATWWNDLNEQFNTFITKAASDGSLNQWIEDGITGFKQIGSIIKSTVSIFGSIDQAARAAGGGGLTRLTENMEKFSKIVASAPFQSTLIHLFAGADAAMQSFASGLGALGGGFAQIGPQIEDTLSLAGEGVKGLLTNLSLIISNQGFADGMVNMFSGFKDAIKSLEPAMAPLGEKFGALMGFAGMMASQFAPVIAQAIISLAPIFMGLIDFLTPIVKILASGLKTILEVAAPFAEQLGAALSGVGDKISSISDPIVGVIAVIAGGFLALVPSIVSVVGAISTFVAGAGGMSGILAKLKGGLGLLGGPVGLVVGSLITLYTTSEDFRNAINGVVSAIVPFIGQLVSGLIPPIMQLANSVFPAISQVLQMVGTAFGQVVAAITPFISQLLGMLVPVITNLANTIFPALGQIIGALVPVIGLIIQAIMSTLVPAFEVLGQIIGPVITILTSIGTVVVPIVTGAISAIADVISGFVALITGDFQGAIDFFKAAGGHMMEGLSAGITAGVEAVIGVFTAIGTRIIDFFKGLFGINSPSTLFQEFGVFLLEGLILGIQSMVEGVLTVFTGLGTSISTVWNTIWTTVSTFVTTVLTNIVTAAVTFGTNILSGFVVIGTNIQTAWNALWTFVSTLVTTVVNTVVTAVVSFGTRISAGFTALVGLVKAVWTAGWNAVIATVTGVITRIVAAVVGFATNISAKIQSLITIVKAAWSAGWNAVISVFTGIVGRIGGAVSGLVSKVTGAISGLIGSVKSTWSAGWNAVISVFSGIVGRIGGAVSGLASKVTGAISGLINSVKSKWSAGWSAVSSGFSGVVSSISGAMGRLGSAISSGVSSAVGFFKGLPGKAIGALSGLAGSLAGVGRNLIQGLINGMSGMIGAAISKVRSIGSSVVSAAKGIFGVKSPSRVFMGIGRDLMRGLDLGLNKNEILVVDRIKTITNNMLKQVDALNAKATKKLAKPGKKATKKQIKAYYNAVNDKNQAKYEARRIKNAADLLTQQTKFSSIFQKSIGKGKTKFNAEYGLQQILKSFYSTGGAKNKKALKVTLKDVEYARDMVEAKLKTAKATLDARIKVRDDQASQMSDRIRGEFSLGNTVDKYTEAGLRPSAKNLLADAKAVLSRITKFGQKLTALKKAGYSAAIITEITNMGSEDGLIAAESLLKATKSEKAGLNSVYKSLDKVSDSIGLNTANAMYKTGIDSAAGLVKGLESQMSQIDKIGKKIGDRLVKATNKSLGVKSPSRVFMGIGGYVGQGFIAGVDKMQGKIDKRMGTMVRTDFDDIRLTNKDTESITTYKSQANNNGNNAPQIIVNPSANLDERAVGNIAASELGFRLYS